MNAGEINISLEDDGNNPIVTGIEVFHDQDNKIMFCDFYNSKLKLLDIYNDTWTERFCSSNPWRMSKTDVPNEIIVTLPDQKCMQLFNINRAGEIIVGGTIKTTLEVYNVNNSKFNGLRLGIRCYQ